MVTSLDNEKQRIELNRQQGRGTGMTQAGACPLAPAPRALNSSRQISGWVKAGFILTLAAPKSLLTLVWGDPGRRRMG